MDKKPYDLAMGDFVDLHDSQSRKKQSLVMLLIWAVLTVFYVTVPGYVEHLSNKGLAIGLNVLIIGAIYFIGMKAAKTGKVLNAKIPQGKVKLLTVLVITLLTVQIGLLTLIVKVSMLTLPMIKLLEIMVSAAMAGICEEVLFRGMLFNSMLTFMAESKYKFLATGAITGLAFGLLHLVNLYHQSLASTVGQIIFATALGMAFGYIRLVSNGMVWPILIHFWQDFSPVLVSSDTGNSNIGLMLTYYVPIAIFMLICIYAYNVRYNKVIASN